VGAVKGPHYLKRNIMAYSTIDDCKNYLPEIYLKQMSDDNDTGELDVEKVNDCLRRAQNRIDSYLRGRYAVPLAINNVPDDIRDISTKLAVYFLFERSLMQIKPESIVNDYKEAERTLAMIQTGKYSPFVIQSNPTWFVSNKASAGNATVNVATQSFGKYLI
jgi:phage gp36-like protein